MSGPPRMVLDPLLLALLGTAAGLAILGGLIGLFGGSGPVLATTPWNIPLISSFITLTTLSVAYLALGRYLVLRRPISYWVGIGYGVYSLGQIFYALTWPGILPGGGSILARLPNTPAVIASFNLILLNLFLLAAVSLRWPEKRNLTGRRWLVSVAVWLVLASGLFSLLILIEPALPVLVGEDGRFTALRRSWSVIQMGLAATGTLLSIRYYRQDGNRLAGYIAFPQLILVFVYGMALIGEQRYDLGWYLARILLALGFQVVLFGLFSEYVRLFRHERESEARLRALLSASAQVLYRMSPDWLEMRQLEGGSFLANTEKPNANWMVEYIHPDDQAWVRARIDHAVRTGAVFELEHRVLRADGATGWTASRAVPVRDAAGEIVEWFGAASDITDRKLAEAALQKRTAELERANRDLQNFSLVASHDLQEPLRKIEVFGDALLEEAVHWDARPLDYIWRMRKSAQQMRDLVNGLLQTTLLTTYAQPFQPVDLAQVAAQIVAALPDQNNPANARVEVGLLPVIEADPYQMKILLQHLVENALKFQPGSGSPQVKIGSIELPAEQVQIQIEDNGIGFDEAHATHLFEPFERLVGKNQAGYDGNGMGLAICRWIVERHSGEITARSESGKGTTLIVTLPVRQPQGLNTLPERESA